MKNKLCGRCGETVELKLTDTISVHMTCKCKSHTDADDAPLMRGLSTSHLPKSEGDILRK